MRYRILVLLALIFLSVGAKPAAAQQQRYIVKTNNGLSSVLNFCLSAGCQVQGALDGAIGKTYAVTSSNTNFLGNLVNGLLQLLERLLGITSVEADRLLAIPSGPKANPAAGLWDTTPVNYYGTTVWNGYVNQPATQIIELQNAQHGFGVSGTGIVADIDTGVDTTHPALSRVLVPGYDFTRNQPGASEWLDIAGMENGITSSDSQDEQPALVQQRTVAVLDQRTVAVLDGGPYADFGHGTMTAGLIHLAAPTAQILPLKAFSANGTGSLSNIIAALYYAAQHNAKVVNMSFDFPSTSPAFSAAVSYANGQGIILVASAGNEGTSTAVYPAASGSSSVVGIASTSDNDVRSSWSNYGNLDVWIAAPGENVVTTYPGGTYASASGTSFSCPLVTGTVDLMLDASSSLTQTKAASALANAIHLTPDINHGRLNVYMALQAWRQASRW